MACGNDNPRITKPTTAGGIVKLTELYYTAEWVIVNLYETKSWVSGLVLRRLSQYRIILMLLLYIGIFEMYRV